MREDVIAAIRAELERQAEAQGEGEPPAHAPCVLASYKGAAFLLIDGHANIENIADAAIEAVMTAARREPIDLERSIFESPINLTDEQVSRLRAQLDELRGKTGPILLEGGFRFVGIRTPNT